MSWPLRGITELLFTSDGLYWLKNGTLPDLFTVVNFQEQPEVNLGALKALQVCLFLLPSPFSLAGKGTDSL